jgi:dinuclear metal center YbgI/SA1388 family protein
MGMTDRSVTVGQCLEILDAAYDPAWAEDWDAVGLVTGDPGAEVRHVHFAVDPTPEVAAEAVAAGAQLLVTHHPLLLRGVHGVAETSAGGRVIASLIRGGCALFAAHTNADVARDGVSDALAALLGLGVTAPVAPLPSPLQPWPELDKLVVFVPQNDRNRLLDELAAAGAGGLGSYNRCAWWASGTGTFRPLEGANPAIGTVGSVEELAEDRLEMIAPRSRRRDVIAALRRAHPYEEPAFDLFELATLPGPAEQARGLGRIGRLEQPLRLDAFVAKVGRVLPRTAWGVRATGDPAKVISTVAVCGGSGGELAGRAAALGADVLVTADARHHHTLDSVAAHGIAIVDAAHWATEHPWLRVAADLLERELAATVRIKTTVSDLVTDPWRMHCCDQVAEEASLHGSPTINAEEGL